jgi:tryptophan synthase alpha chain
MAAAFARLASSKKKALIPFVTAGDPTKEITVPLMHELVAAGADVIELGVPFSDPMAYVRTFRESNKTTPVVLMGYANPIERMGLAHFAKTAKDAGVDGVLVVDYPPEESAEILKALDAVEIDSIYLLSPTSTASRIELVAKSARGYIYYVSLKGVTGAANIDTADVKKMIAAIRTKTSLPVGVGFGIRDGETARRVADCADAVVIGSRIIQELEASSAETALSNVRKLVHGIRVAMDA